MVRPRVLVPFEADPLISQRVLNSDLECSMSYTYKALASVWLIVFWLFALSGSGMVAGLWVLLLVGAALVMPALILSPL